MRPPPAIAIAMFWLLAMLVVALRAPLMVWAAVLVINSPTTPVSTLKAQ